jgi:hypothetical protein
VIASKQNLSLQSFFLRKKLSREIFVVVYKINLAKKLSQTNFLSFIIGSAPRSKSSEHKTVIAPTAAPVTQTEPKATKASIKAEAKAKKDDAKKKKDPHGLKRPLSAYMLFNNSRRPLIKQDFPSKYSNILFPWHFRLYLPLIF